MAKIIKHHQVDVAGRFQLQHPNQSHNQAIAESPKAEDGKETLVRVLEKNDQASVLEVTCPCGHVILIRCEHE